MNHECDSCLERGIHTPATTKSINLDLSDRELCEDCATESDSQQYVSVKADEYFEQDIK